MLNHGLPLPWLAHRGTLPQSNLSEEILQIRSESSTLGILRPSCGCLNKRSVDLDCPGEHHQSVQCQEPSRASSSPKRSRKEWVLVRLNSIFNGDSKDYLRIWKWRNRSFVRAVLQSNLKNEHLSLSAASLVVEKSAKVKKNGFLAQWS